MADKLAPVEKLLVWIHRQRRSRGWVAGTLDVAPETVSRWFAGIEPTEGYRKKLSTLTSGFVPEKGEWA
jgi:hypothetical protein